MNNVKKYGPASFLSLGVAFLLIGLVQQGFILSFKSGFSNLGIIFTLSGLVGAALTRDR